MGIFTFNNKQNAGKDYFSTAIYSATPQKKITEEMLLTIPSARMACELITSTIAQLPIYEYTESNSQMQKIENSSVVEMFEKPNRYETFYSLKKKLVQDYLLYGKAYLYHKNNELVYLFARDMEERKFTEDGISFSRKEFIYNSYQGEVTLPEHEVIVIDSSSNGLLVDGGEIFSLALAQMTYESSLMSSGALPTGVLKASSRLTEPAIKRLRESWANLYSGSSKAGKTIVLEEGLDYQQITLNPNDLMFNESKKSVDSAIAKLFSIPESMIDPSANKYASNEANRISFYQNTISPIITAFEEAFSSILDNGNFLRFSTEEILRATEEERVKNTTELFEKGLIDLNESRYRLDLPKVEDSENYKLFSLGSVIQHDDNTISIPNLGIYKGERLEKLNDKN